MYNSAQRQGYTVDSASGDDSFGITVIRQNAETFCIWDSLTITITDPFDQRVNFDTNASGIVVSAIYDYDNSPFDGTLSLNNTQFNYGSSQRQGYRVQGISGGAHGITAISIDDETFCIWDALIISITDSPDQRIDVNQNASGVVVSARYDYDNSIYDGTLILNDTGFVSAVAIKKGYTVLSAIGDDFYGITSILSNDETWCIWDQILVFSLQASDARDNVDDPIWVDVILRFEYDNAPVEDGSVTVNGYIFQHLGLGLWRHNRTESSVTSITFDSVVCAGNGYNIQSVNQNSQSQSVIWDVLKVTITIDDRRIDVGSTASIQANAVYDYDEQSFDGILTLNDTVHVHDTVGLWAYTVVSASGDSYGISLIGINDIDYVIWDQLRILSYWVDEADGRTNVGTTRQVYVTADYEYDGSVFQGAFGTIFMNGSAMTWNPALLRWNHTFSYSTPVGYVFQISGVSDLLYGLTTIREQMSPLAIIWDRLNVVIESDTSVAFIDEFVRFTVTATYQYDNTRVPTLTVEIATRNGTATEFGNFTNTWTGPEDALLQYIVVSAEDGLYGISELETVMIEVLWTNAPVVEVDDAFTSDGDGRVDIGTTVYIYFHCVWLKNNSPVETGLLYVNSTPYSINETGWVRITNSSMDVLHLKWNVTGADVEGVTSYKNDEPLPEITWDALRITIEFDDYRINVGSRANESVKAYYSSDGSEYYGGLTLNDTDFREFTVQRKGYTVIAAAGDDIHGITAIESIQEASVIWDGLNIQLSVDQNRVDVGQTVTINVFVVYAYDETVFDGIYTLNDNVFTQDRVGMRVYTILEDFLAGDTHGIDEIISNSGTYVIWDELEVYKSEVERRRCDLGGSVEVRFWLRYSFDEAPYSDANGTLQINATEAAYSVSSGYWYRSVIHHDVGSYRYVVTGFNDSSSAVTRFIDAGGIVSMATFDNVYVLLAGVRGTNITSGSEVNLLAPDILQVPIGSQVTIYFKLRYQSDDATIANPNTIVRINGQIAVFVEGQDLWEVTFIEPETALISYLIDSFEDEYGLTQVDHRGLIPTVDWSVRPIPPLPPDILLFMMASGAGLLAVAFAIRTRRRVTTLEHALTPEELLSLEDVGISSTMRAQIVNQLEWLRDLSEEIPYMGNDVLTVLNEELAQAKQMYVKAFELEPPSEPAGLQLRDMLLNRIDSILESIGKELKNR
jgi:hypothetical protein